MKRRIVSLLLLMSLFSCKQIIKEAIESGSNATVEVLEPSDFNEVEVDDEYKLSLPNYMKEMNNLNDDASLEYANIYKETYTIVIGEDKQEFIDSFKEIGEYNEESTVIDNYSNVQTMYFKESVENLQVIPYNVDKIGNLDARQVMMKGHVEGEDIGYLIGYVEGKDNVYMIMTWTLKERLNKYEQTFKDIVASFKLIN